MALMHDWAGNVIATISIRQLEHRFGPMSPEIRNLVDNLPYDALDELGIAILDFHSLAEAEAWLTRHRQDSSIAT